MNTTIGGSCLCGKVRYRIEGPFTIFQYCLCSRCRKVSGSAHSANLFVPPERFQWLQGEEWLGRYEVPGARYFATTFCRNCGSSLPWLVQGGKNVVVTAGTLDEDPGIRPQQTLFWASRAPWFVEPGDLPKYDGLPR